MGVSSFSKADFDFTNLQESYLSNLTNKAIIAPYKYPSNSDSMSMAFAMYRTNADTLTKPILIQTKKGQLVRHIDIENWTQQVITIRNGNIYGPNTQVVNYTTQSNGKFSRCGQAVNDCIINAYSQHGWLSVYLFVQTAFIPATAVGIATGCTAKNCF